MSDNKRQYQRKQKASTQQAAQLQGASVLADNRPASVQRQKRNTTGLPDNLKSGMESLSGMSLDHVKVHYNSSKPAMVQAHAYAQGSDIHLAPGQSHHLPHELGHVVQQAQGRVKPTTQVNGMNVNDNAALEHEATVMGNKALQRASHDRYAGANFSLQQQRLKTSEFAQFKSMDSVGLEGIGYAVMSRKTYQRWQHSEQATAQLHGKCEHGQNIIVTQFQDKELGTKQLAGLGHKVKGGLLIAEGGLTLAAGVAVLIASHFALSVPAIAAIIVGGSKILRGILTYTSQGKPSKSAVAIMDACRALESISAIVGGAFSGNVFGIVFGAIKAFRSATTAYADYLQNVKDEQGNHKHPKRMKALKWLNSGLHVLELVAATGAGVTGLNSGKTSSTILGGATLASNLPKKARAIDQVNDAAGNNNR
ncbi:MULTISPECIES: DUF4157 domain-containing protein [Pseudoalteromonas]|uniref:eCIS core domain-containing protein n=1 Tax=Pseudoalteromonas TaxID=53246 RepID=UPI0009F6601D|nr:MULTISPECIES: DUF4157 domain-containing protein [Pseudoalteromonas]